jgi:hypothetical protein
VPTQLTLVSAEFLRSSFYQSSMSRSAEYDELTLDRLLLSQDNIFALRSLGSESAGRMISYLMQSLEVKLDGRVIRNLLRELASYVAVQSGRATKSGITGIDIELERDSKRYLIAVKSGKAWGNATQHKKLRDNFQTAVKVLKQNSSVGEIQPTLGICYGRFKTVNNGAFLHIGGQSFWELISAEPNLYKDIIEPIGHRAKEFNTAFGDKKEYALNRMVREFTSRFCREDGSINWQEIVEFVSKNS